MWTYTPPVADQLHILTRVLDAPAQWARLAPFADLDAETAAEVLAQAGRFAAEVLLPLNAPGDRQGCRWSPEGVKTPDGFAAAWQAYVAGGWPALAAPVDDGGQGLPEALNLPLNEMIAAANHGWTMYPGLLHGACEVVRHHAVPALRERYLPPLVSGEWLATMCLTEPQAGSDLGRVRSQMRVDGDAQPANGAPVRVSGSKIFISGGDHDLTDNIVHLVLARLPDAAPGSRGLSLALVPRMLPDGTRNAVFCDGIEHKMGIHGSATCQMRFEQAEGWLIGEPHRGLAAMFRMMNSARLHVAMQGLGHLEIATQNAWAYAAEREQMRAPGRPEGAAATAGGADPIAWHPAMRRLLLGLRARADAARVIALHGAMLLDAAEHDGDATRRQAAADQVAILTPVAKAFFTELGHRGADEALQAWGGYGFVAEYGIEQVVRDSRIAMIYEGSNEIQAIDLVQRKLLDDGGRRARAFIEALSAEVQAGLDQPETRPFADALAGQLQAWREALDALLAGQAADGGADAEYPLRVADDMLAGVGHALMAWAWAKLARAALELQPGQGLAGGRSAQSWWQAAQYGLQWLLPQARVHWARVAERGAALPFLAA
ncbi:MAG: acyl-CoA dehydrogenase family protein [Burkholderiaceae bacterium]|nr:acyl-CoA dehydrogenase family protein [Burkholderiaceae bacterium]